ncbi:MAG TPA: ATP-binding protein [Vicinamibacterales bacterium]|nr:ATP-binding protein [Vicinamibacterales bacterium]
MTAFKDLPIRRKALLLGLVPTVTAILLVILSSIVATYIQARTNMLGDLQAEAVLVTDNVSAALAFNDQKSASDTLRAYRSKTNIDAVCVFDSAGRLFSSFERVPGRCASPSYGALSNGPGPVYEQTVMLGNRSVGMVRVAANFSRLSAWTRRQALVGLGTFIVGVFLSFLLTQGLSRSITEPLHNLAATADLVSTSRDYSIRATKITSDEVGKLVGSFNSMLDQIQEQSNLSAQSLEREREASRLKDHFLAAVSHELRTPLNAILGWLQIIQTTAPGKNTVKRALESLERNARTQARVVEDLIDISRVVTGKLQLRAERMDLRGAIKAALDVVDSAVQAKTIHLASTLPEKPVVVRGDADRLQQVMWNLLSNAVKFTPAGGKVTVDLSVVAGDALVTVSDSGIGIAPEFIPFVFDRFRQADGSMTREHGGLGLGLAIARELTDLHGGSLSVSSSGRGQGATFVLRLPRIASLAHPAPTVSGAAAAPPDGRGLGGVRVLAVDDDADALEVISEALRGAGASLETARSGSEAIEACRHKQFDVLVCDLAMPGMDGFTVIREIKEMTGDAGFPFAIALSAHTLREDEERSRGAGFHLHLGKPFSLPALIDAILAHTGN